MRSRTSKTGWDGMGWERFMQLHLREKSASDVLRYMYLANAVMALTFPLAGLGTLTSMSWDYKRSSVVIHYPSMVARESSWVDPTAFGGGE